MHYLFFDRAFDVTNWIPSLDEIETRGTHVGFSPRITLRMRKREKRNDIRDMCSSDAAAGDPILGLSHWVINLGRDEARKGRTFLAPFNFCLLARITKREKEKISSFMFCLGVDNHPLCLTFQTIYYHFGKCLELIRLWLENHYRFNASFLLYNSSNP